MSMFKERFEALDSWLDNVHTLHYSVEVAYVVDGYEGRIVRDGEHIDSLPPEHGEGVIEVYEKLMAKWWFNPERRAIVPRKQR